MSDKKNKHCDNKHKHDGHNKNHNRACENEKSTKDEELDSKNLAQNEENNANEQDKDKIIETLKQEIEAFNDKYLRIYADFENVKKRLQKDKESALEYANENFARDLLSGLDALEGGIKASAEHKAIQQGLQLAMDSFIKTLNKYGVEKIQAQSAFDPSMHECVMQVQNNELNDGDIAQVLQTGYKYKDRILRPSLVSVIKN